jgi:hypothetical protein
MLEILINVRISHLGLFIFVSEKHILYTSIPRCP